MAPTAWARGWRCSRLRWRCSWYNAFDISLIHFSSLVSANTAAIAPCRVAFAERDWCTFGFVVLKLGLQACVRDLLVGHDELIASTVATINGDANDVKSLLKSASLLRTASTTAVEFIAGMGELWSARTLSVYLTAKGTPAVMMDAREVVTVAKKEIGLGEKGAAVDMEMEPLFDLMVDKLDEWWAREAAELVGSNALPVLVITGFIASTPDGVPTTLKRSGSDYTATIIASLLQSKKVSPFRRGRVFGHFGSLFPLSGLLIWLTLSPV